MSYLIKGVVSALLAIICALVIRGYGGYMKKRLTESGELLRLCETIRKSIATRLLTPREALSGVSGLSPATERFRALVASGSPLGEAFAEVSGALSVSPATRDMLSEYFGSFGKGYLDDEVRCADELIGRFREQLLREELAAEGELKVAKSVIIAVTLGIIILII